MITIGRLGRSRGLTGAMYVTPETDFPDRFLDLDEIYIRNKDNWEKWKIAGSDMVGGRPVLEFDKITSREQASRFINRELAVPSDQLVELPEGEHFLFQLIDCEVIDEKTGTRIGKIVDVQQYPANDVYVIETDDGTKVQVPVVKQFVKKVDAEGKRIVIDKAGLSE